jgi:uncharacterized membrane protein
MLPIPCAYLIASVILGRLSPEIDKAIGSHVSAAVGIGAARDILTSTATGMIAFTGLVVASVLVAVQFAAGQYSPRLVLWFRRDPIVLNAIGTFLAAPLFALVALRELERQQVTYGADVTVVVALALLVAAVILFLLLLQRVIDRIRPRSLYRRVARQGVHAARALYPTGLDGPDDEPVPAPADWRAEDPRSLPVEHEAGVITSFDLAVLQRAALLGDVTIELAPAIGEFISTGATLLRIHGDGPVDPDTVYGAVTVSEERTIEQDPAFAIRVMVDTAIRALSPAVNDPTTAVNGLDSLEVILRELAARDLERSLWSDAGGTVRVAWRAATWEDILDLAFDEIRGYGASAVQVCRRLRALLLDLRASAPPSRQLAIDEHLRRLDAAIALAYPAGSPDLPIARVADRTGLGLGRR